MNYASCGCLLILVVANHPVSGRDEILEFSVTPADSGQQLVRTSLPFRTGAVPTDEPLLVTDGQRKIDVAIRPLTWHSDSEDQRSVRRALVTFPYVFRNRRPVDFRLQTGTNSNTASISFPLKVERIEQTWLITWPDHSQLAARPVWPIADPKADWQHRSIEENEFYSWHRWDQVDHDWQRRVELRCDALGQAVFIAHLQRRESPGHYAPKFGWECVFQNATTGEIVPPSEAWRDFEQRVGDVDHSFRDGEPFQHTIESSGYRWSHPAAPAKLRGTVFADQEPSDLVRYRYLRSTPADRVPMSAYTWRRAELVVGPVGSALPNASLTSPHSVRIDPDDWNALYGTGAAVLAQDNEDLQQLLVYHSDAVIAAAAVGHDWGNVTVYRDGRRHGGVFGMNRLNHNPAIFFTGMRTGSRQLIETAINWCDNFFDLSIAWQPAMTGGTRYNNLRASNEIPPDDDWTYMWRGDTSKSFCTKGYDSFLLAWAETGDPRMIEALNAQVEYATEHVHANDGECRNIGDVADLVRLYECTGESRYLQQALRLFRELRTVLGDDNLFSQAGKPIVPAPGFIDEDEMGKRFPFAKPYIIGYTLAGCPQLARHAPDEPRLVETVLAVADFLAESQDPLGGWRYPHPRSSRLIVGQAMEHAWQLVQASQLVGPQSEYLDAIERVLRLRIWIWRKTGSIASNLVGREISSGQIEDPLDIYMLYERPEDRDREPDYAAGRLELGVAAPESIVYFPEVLRFYLRHRTVARLLEPPTPDSPLGQVLANLDGKDLQSPGVKADLPVFRKSPAERLTFPGSWANASGQTFDAWRKRARQQVRRALLAPPPNAPFEATTVGSQKFTGYTSHKLHLSLSADSRVPAYLLIPDGDGPFPAVLLLHDHGAEFRIGKEKVVRPWADSADKIDLAAAWIDKYYGGRFLGEELARRGYVCLAIDALNWSDRGGAGFRGQQALASNLMHLGMSLAGVIAYDDLRAAEFLATRPQVDASRVAAMGLSMGGFRTWQVAALSPHIASGVAICWLATVDGLMVPGNNQTEGHSAFTMLHPGLLDDLDYPDIASIACPKPMLFFNGRRDRLFPVDSVQAAYEKLRTVWSSQGVDDRLVTRLWDVPHVFNRPMQDAAMNWLESLK